MFENLTNSYELYYHSLCVPPSHRKPIKVDNPSHPYNLNSSNNPSNLDNPVLPGAQ